MLNWLMNFIVVTSMMAFWIFSMIALLFGTMYVIKVSFEELFGVEVLNKMQNKVNLLLKNIKQS